ncbi:MAG: formyltransferase family protein [Phycisphaerales bacterium]
MTDQRRASQALSPPRLACLISGGGRTVLNLLDSIERSELNATIPLVISSNDTAAGVQRCRDRGLFVKVIPGVIPADTLEALLREHNIDLVLLAGYLKLLKIPPSYHHRVLNIHPSLLPKHGGKGMHGHHVHEAVLKAKDQESGCTVHYVDDQFDTGAPILQFRCPVLPTDTPETLAARVFELECKAFPQAIRMALSCSPPAGGGRG